LNFNITVAMKLTAQTVDCLSFEVLLQNQTQTRLLLPVPSTTCIHFESVITKRVCDWFTGLMVSRKWAGFCLEPYACKTLEYLVRPSSTPSPTDWDGSDYSRWSLDLSVGVYTVWFELQVDKEYFCPDSHLRHPQLDRIAAEQDAMVWLGTVRSKAVEISILSRSG